MKKALKEFLKSHKEVVRVILFGSFARDDYFPGSDIDLLLALKSSSKPFLQRLPEYHILFSMPVEVFPFTDEEIKRRCEEQDLFIKGILKEGQTLYEASEQKKRKKHGN